VLLFEKPTLFFQVTSGVSFPKLCSSSYSLTSPGLISKIKASPSLLTAVIDVLVYRPTGLSRGHSALPSPVVAGNGPCFQVSVRERIDSGAQPLTLPLVHGVKNMNNLIALHWQGAAVQLAGDVQVQADVKGVPRCDQPFLQFRQQRPVTCGSKGRGEAPSATGQTSVLLRCWAPLGEAHSTNFWGSLEVWVYTSGVLVTLVTRRVWACTFKTLMGHWFRNSSSCWYQNLWEYSHYNDTFT